MADPNVLIPADLNFNGYPDPSDKNYWDVKITGLKPNTGYGIQFQWVFEGGKLGLWSATRYILTNAVPAPGEPELSLSNVQGGQGVIKVTWSGKDSGGNTIPNVKRVNIHISGGKFGDGSTPADYFLEPGTKIIAAEAGVYMVQLKALAADEKTYSVFSQVRTVTVTGTSVIVETPTLPTGLSVSQSAFAVAVNWGGTYSGNNFEGFKSIDVHVSGSDLGATTTSGFSASTQVATLTVNSTTNRQNVGLDNLRVALGLASNNDAYTAPMFFYYIARNSKDELYSVNGNPTYTRINSTSVNPKKANLIDLENGLISIQNLVAGNGQFASWLRAGGDGGARIELSGTDTTTPSGSSYPVKKGLVAYSTGNVEIFNLDIGTSPKLTIRGDGEFSGSLAIGAGNNIFKAEPNAGSSVRGIWLGHADFGSAPFSVANTGIIKAESGTVGGLTLSAQSIGNTGNTFKIDKDGIITLGATSGNHIRIASDGTEAGIYHKLNNNTVGNFKITTSGTMQLGNDIGTQNFLTWNGNSLTMRGNIEIIGGVTKQAIDEAAQKAQQAKDAQEGFAGSLAGLSITVSGNTSSIGQLNTFKEGVADPNTNYTTINGGKISTGVIASNAQLGGLPYTAIDLDSGDLYLAGGALTFDSNPLNNSFIMTIGNMKIGRNLFPSSGTSTEGIWINTTNYWQSDGKFALGDNILSFGGGTAVRGNPLFINSGYIRFTNFTNSILESDGNNYAGDNTVVLNTSGELTRGRAFYYGSTTTPTSANTSRQVYDSYTGGYVSVAFRAGDIWMTVD